MDGLTPKQAVDLLFIQGLIGCNETQVKANLIHYHGAEWKEHITPIKETLCEKV